MGESPGNSTNASQSARRYRVAGMSSTNCAGRVERALKSLPGVESATVDLDRSEVLIRISSGIDEPSLAEVVEHAGYTLLIGSDTEPHSPPEPDEPVWQSEPPPARSWRDFIPSAATVWVVATRGIAIGLVISLLWTLALRFLPAPFTLMMVSESLFEGHNIRHTWVPLERISPHLVRAVIASEDDDFCHHWGFDFKESQDALDKPQDGGRLRGASTISQQTAKNVFLWQGRSCVRKASKPTSPC